MVRLFPHTSNRVKVVTDNVSGAERALCIDAYNDAHFVLFPLKDNRTPAYNGWQKTLITEDELPAAYGFLIPFDIFVLDFDPRRGTEQLIDFKNKIGEHHFENAFVVETPRGGYHLYFRKPENVKLAGNVPEFKAIEVKQKGQYVVAAGSYVQTSTHSGWYTVISGNPCDIPIASPELFAACKPLTEKVLDAAPDQLQNEELSQIRFIKWCKTVDVAKTAYETVCEGKDYGLSALVIAQIMFDHLNPRWSEPATLQLLVEKAQNAFNYGQNKPGARNLSHDFDNVDLKALAPDAEPAKSDPNLEIKWDFIKGSFNLKSTMHNVMMYLRSPEIRVVGGATVANPLYDLLKYNQFNEQVTFQRRAPWHDKGDWNHKWHDSDAVLMKAWFFQSQHFDVTTNNIEDAVLAHAYQHQYHPVCQWLDGLPPWDGTPRLDFLFSRYAGAPEIDYVKSVSALTLIGAVARVFEPGCQHDTMTIMEGLQNSGKTSFVRILGGEFGSEIILNPEKPAQNIHNMIGKWIIEVPELEFTRHSNTKAVKAFLSIKQDHDRLSYERHSRTRKRQSIFIGTINPEGNGYFRDTTGNRRFLPVATGKIDLEALKRDRDQLFAEALVRYRRGEPHHLVSEHILGVAKAEQRERMFKDVWEDVLLVNLANSEKFLFTNVEIAEEILLMPRSRLDNRTLLRISYAMQALGYERKMAYNKRAKREILQWYKPGTLGELE